MPKLLSKSEIADIMGVPVRRLKDKVFTSSVLQKLHISEDEYKHLRIFTLEQSMAIKRLFDIRKEETEQPEDV
jgi:hypothetical protein